MKSEREQPRLIKNISYRGAPYTIFGKTHSAKALTMLWNSVIHYTTENCRGLHKLEVPQGKVNILYFHVKCNK